MLVASSIAQRDLPPMAKGKRPKPGDGVPDDIKQEEGAALKRLWDSRAKRTQAVFLADLDLSAGYLPQFFAGTRPIYLDLGIALAAELNIDLEDFSPRLARERDQRIQAAEWPFTGFTRADFKHLTPSQRQHVESTVLELLRANGHVPARRLRRVV